MWKSLSLKLISAFLLVAVIAVVAVSLIQSRQIEQSLISDSGHLLHTRAESEARLISTVLDAQIAHLRDIGVDDRMVDSEAEQEAAYPADPAAANRQIAAADAVWSTASPNHPLVVKVLNSVLAANLRAHARIDPNIAELMLTDRRGGLIAASGRTSDYNQADEEWWQRAVADGLFVGSPDYDNSSGSFSIIIAISLYDIRQGTFIGVLRSTYRTDAITLQMAETRFSHDVQVALLVGDRILKSGATQLVMPEAADLTVINQTRSTSYVLTSFEGQPRLIALAPVLDMRGVKPLSWSVLLYQDRSDVLKPVWAAQKATLIAALIVLAVAALVAGVSAELISVPIRRITNVAERIAAGDPSQRVGAYGNDEIGRLARSFDQMTVALQERSAAEQNAQAERLRIQQVLIDAQHHRIEELTTPTIPLGHGTLLLPLIGSIDQDRAARVLLTLLADVHTQRAQNLIIDLSGIHIVDAQVMAVLVSAARAVRLLGARVTLVGIRAEAAHTLVDLELDLSDITIYANLHDAFDAER